MPKTTRPRGRPATGAERRSISLPVDVWDKIEAAADGRPLSVEVGRLVEDGFSHRSCLRIVQRLQDKHPEFMRLIIEGAKNPFETPEMRAFEAEVSKAFRKKAKQP